MGLSAFAEMALVSEHSLVKVDADLNADIAELFGCAVMCGAGSIINTAAVKSGETVAIAGIGGVGGVGASAILGAKLAGAQRIIAIDPDPEKRQAALELGATDAIAASDDAADQIVELAKGGVDCALESAGVLEAFDTAYRAAKRGGRVVTIGLVSPKTPFSLDVASLVTEAKTVIDSYMGSCDAVRDIPRFIAHYKRGKLPVDQLITRRLGLDDINLALERMASSKAFRQIITP